MTATTSEDRWERDRQVGVEEVLRKAREKLLIRSNIIKLIFEKTTN